MTCSLKMMAAAFAFQSSAGCAGWPGRNLPSPFNVEYSQKVVLFKVIERAQ